MEMHQVRYFLAVSRELNFTRAAETCNVAQPSLTRAIKQLEEELGGELFRRERNLTHLSELGHRMRPMLQQCYDSALSAKSVAQSIKTGTIAPLSIALSYTVNIMLLVPFLTELVRVFPGLELRFLRGTTADIAELLKKGEAEVAVAGPLEGSWDRLDGWPLFSEPYKLLVGQGHRLMSAGRVAPGEISKERLLCRINCEHVQELSDFLTSSGSMPKMKHNVWSEQDLIALLEVNMGVGMAPASSADAAKIGVLSIDGLTVERTVHVYGVAGRQRSMAASTLIKMLRAADWHPAAAAVKPAVAAAVQAKSKAAASAVKSAPI